MPQTTWLTYDVTSPRWINVSGKVRSFIGLNCILCKHSNKDKLKILAGCWENTAESTVYTVYILYKKCIYTIQGSLEPVGLDVTFLSFEFFNNFMLNPFYLFAKKGCFGNLELLTGLSRFSAFLGQNMRRYHWFYLRHLPLPFSLRSGSNVGRVVIYLLDPTFG